MVQVAGYDVLGQIGSGSSAVVYKAHDPRLDRTVALKRVAVADAEALRAEAATLARLRDDHLVAVFGFVEEDDAAYLIEEWIDGATLEEVLRTGATLEERQALGIIRGALLGLAHAHAQGVAHGDVSASNVLVDSSGVSRMIDFGSGGTGTPAYRSPEVANGAAATPASDVYSAAAVLTHLLTGRAARPPETSGTDRAVRTVLDRALATDPGDRYPDAGRLLAALEEAASRGPGAAWWTEAGLAAIVSAAIPALVAAPGAAGAPPSPEPRNHASRPTRRGTRIAGLVAAAAVLVTVVSVVTVVLTHHAHGTPPPAAGGPDKVLPASSVPTGTYSVVTVLVSERQLNGRVFARHRVVGPRVTWTFERSGCSAARCTGTIRSSSGRHFPYTWDGHVLTIVRRGADARWDGPVTCVYTGSHRAMPRAVGHAIEHQRTAFEPAAVPAGPEPAAAFSVWFTNTRTWDVFGQCHTHGYDVVVQRYRVDARRRA